jgi:hypothetical protein
MSISKLLGVVGALVLLILLAACRPEQPDIVVPTLMVLPSVTPAPTSEPTPVEPAADDDPAGESDVGTDEPDAGEPEIVDPVDAAGADSTVVDGGDDSVAAPPDDSLAPQEPSGNSGGLLGLFRDVTSGGGGEGDDVAAAPPGDEPAVPLVPASTSTEVTVTGTLETPGAFPTSEDASIVFMPEPTGMSVFPPRQVVIHVDLQPADGSEPPRIARLFILVPEDTAPGSYPLSSMEQNPGSDQFMVILHPNGQSQYQFSESVIDGTIDVIEAGDVISATFNFALNADEGAITLNVSGGFSGVPYDPDAPLAG